MEAASPASEARPRILLVNQAAGPVFAELAEDLSTILGPVGLLTGSPLQTASPALDVRYLSSLDRSGVFARGWSWLRFVRDVSAAVREVDRSVPLLVVSNPPFLPWLAGILHVRRKQRFAVLVYDIYPDILVGMGRLGASHPVARIWRTLNKWAYSRADCLFTIGYHMGLRLSSYLPESRRATAVRVIPTWVDTSRFRPIAKDVNPLAQQWAQRDKITVLYSGNIGFSHDISLVIDTALAMRDDARFHFVIAGEGPGKAALASRAAEAGIANVTFLPYQDAEDFPVALAVGDIAVVSIRQGAQGCMMPSKTYYSMAVGSAIIGISEAPNDLSDATSQHGCGINVAPGDTHAFVTALRGFADDPARLVACRSSSRRAAVECYSRDPNTRRFSQELAAALLDGCARSV